jgi:hypothetical protein
MAKYFGVAAKIELAVELESRQDQNFRQYERFYLFCPTTVGNLRPDYGLLRTLA